MRNTFTPRSLIWVALLSIGGNLITCSERQTSVPIDRLALVTRNNILLTKPDTLGSLSVGNGEFAFTVDVSGLQTFVDEYENGIPMGTQSQWAWHGIPQSQNYTLNDVAVNYESCDGSYSPYPVQHKEGRAGMATNVLRANPHRLHLGNIGLTLLKQDGSEVLLDELTAVRQQLDLWTGMIESTYEVEAIPVRVLLYAHQQEDRIAARIESPLIQMGRLRVQIKFPYGKDCHVCPGYDYDSQSLAKHTSAIISESKGSAVIGRRLDSTSYFMRLDWRDKTAIIKPATHRFELEPAQDSTSLEFTALFTRDSLAPASTFSLTKESSIAGWKNFWTSGGAIDFSACTDPRAKELERRVVLSQYLTRIQCTGSLPPQETGLTMNSWYGKFHLEMHWWHATHFALWGRPALMEPSLNWYNQVLPKARSTAKWQGYSGARWQKMTDPYGNESPSSVGAFIIWQQPHPIYLAELLYRNEPTQATLSKYKDIVFSTADFMASFARRRGDTYHLCHPLIPAQEIFKAAETDDPAFELQYWYHGLATAQRWRSRLGMEENELWNDIIAHLAPLAIKDSLYLPNATTIDAYTNDQYRRDHPAVAGALGFLPWNDRVDTTVMAKTLEDIMQRWQWESTWGWDYPMLAMTATRLNKPDVAIQALLMDVQKNTYLVNGHNYQDKRLRLYLPGNGGLLSAVSLMAAGWDGCRVSNPGFPNDGKWKLKWEGLKQME